MPKILELRQIDEHDPSATGPHQVWARFQYYEKTDVALRLLTEVEFGLHMRRARREAYDEILTLILENRDEQ